MEKNSNNIQQLANQESESSENVLRLEKEQDDSLNFIKSVWTRMSGDLQTRGSHNQLLIRESDNEFQTTGLDKKLLTRELDKKLHRKGLENKSQTQELDNKRQTSVSDIELKARGSNIEFQTRQSDKKLRTTSDNDFLTKRFESELRKHAGTYDGGDNWYSHDEGVKASKVNEGHSYEFYDVQNDAALDDRGSDIEEVDCQDKIIKNKFSLLESNEKTVNISKSSPNCSNDHIGDIYYDKNIKNTNLSTQNIIPERDQANGLKSGMIKWYRTINIKVTTSECATKNLFKGRKVNTSRRATYTLQNERFQKTRNSVETVHEDSKRNKGCNKNGDQSNSDRTYKAPTSLKDVYCENKASRNAENDKTLRHNDDSEKHSQIIPGKEDNLKHGYDGTKTGMNDENDRTLKHNDDSEKHSQIIPGKEDSLKHGYDGIKISTDNENDRTLKHNPDYPNHRQIRGKEEKADDVISNSSHSGNVADDQKPKVSEFQADPYELENQDKINISLGEKERKLHDQEDSEKPVILNNNLSKGGAIEDMPKDVKSSIDLHGADEKDLNETTEASEKNSTPANIKMLTLAENAGFEVCDVTPDGNCMYRSVVDQLRMQGEFDYTVIELRRKTVQYLRENPLHEDGTHLRAFVPSEEWDVYLRRMQKDGEWGDQIMLKGIAEVTERRICIFSTIGDSHNGITIEPSKAEADQSENIFLGHIDDSHYVSLRPKDWLQKWFASARNTMQKENNAQSSKQNFGNPQETLNTTQETLNTTQKTQNTTQKTQDLPCSDEFIDHISGVPILHLTFIIRNVLNAKYLRTDEEARTEIMSAPDVEYKGFSKLVIAGSLMENFSVSLSSNSQWPTSYLDHHRNKCLVTAIEEPDVYSVIARPNYVVLDIENASENTRYVACTNGVHQGYLLLQVLNPRQGERRQITWINGDIPCLNNASFQKTEDIQWKQFLNQWKHLDPLLKYVKNAQCAFWSGSWPELASEWLSRDRKSGWPDICLQNEVASKGCLIVPISHPSSKYPECEWGLSFAESETLLAKNISKYERHCFLIFKVLVQFYMKNKNFLSSYVLKTVFFHVLETMPRRQWKDAPGVCVLGLFDMLLGCLRSQNMPHYFISKNNIIDYVSPEDNANLLSQLEVIRQYPMVSCMLLAECHGLISASIADPILEDANRFREDRDIYQSVNKVLIPHLFDIATTELRIELFEQAVDAVQEAYGYLVSSQSLCNRDDDVMPLNQFIQNFLSNEPVTVRFWFCFFMDYYHGTNTTPDLGLYWKTKAIKEIVNSREEGMFDDVQVPFLNRLNLRDTVPNERVSFLIELCMKLYLQTRRNDSSLFSGCAHYMRCTIKVIKDEIDALIQDTSDGNDVANGTEKSGSISHNTAKSMNYPNDRVIYLYNAELAEVLISLHNCYFYSGQVILFQEYMEDYVDVCGKMARPRDYENLAKIWNNLGEIQKAQEALGKKRALER